MFISRRYLIEKKNLISVKLVTVYFPPRHCISCRFIHQIFRRQRWQTVFTSQNEEELFTRFLVQLVKQRTVTSVSLYVDASVITGRSWWQRMFLLTCSRTLYTAYSNHTFWSFLRRKIGSISAYLVIYPPPHNKYIYYFCIFVSCFNFSATKQFMCQIMHYSL